MCHMLDRLRVTNVADGVRCIFGNHMGVQLRCFFLFLFFFHIKTVMDFSTNFFGRLSNHLP